MSQTSWTLRVARMRPLLLACVTVPVLAWAASGFPGQWWPLINLVGAAIAAVMAAALTGALHMAGSIFVVRRYADAMGQVDLRRLWSERRPVSDMAISALMLASLFLAVSGCAYIADIYRAAAVWYDSAIWAWERPLFEAVWASPMMDLPLGIWERVYFTMWPYLVGTIALLLVRQRDSCAMEAALAAIFVFYLAQMTALFVPVAGPALATPEVFSYLDGTQTRSIQAALAGYKQGAVAQNGVFYALVAFPSVHVALTALAGSYLVGVHRALWPVAVIVLTAIWLSTLVLGWHYAIDGLAGVATALVARGAAWLMLH